MEQERKIVADGKTPGILLTDVNNEGKDYETATVYYYVPMIGGINDADRTPFMQVFFNVDKKPIEYWVADGYYNKRRYKTYKNASRALNVAIGELVLAGWLPSRELTGHHAEFSKDMKQGFQGYYLA